MSFGNISSCNINSCCTTLLQLLIFVVTTLAQKFLSEWCKDDEESHPALEVLKRLLKTSDLLSPTVRNPDHPCVFITVAIVTNVTTSTEGSTLHFDGARL